MPHRDGLCSNWGIFDTCIGGYLILALGNYETYGGE